MRKSLVAALAVLVVAAAAPAQGYGPRRTVTQYYVYPAYAYPAVTYPGYSDPSSATPYYLQSGGALGAGHLYSGHYYSGHIFNTFPNYGQGYYRP